MLSSARMERASPRSSTASAVCTAPIPVASCWTAKTYPDLPAHARARMGLARTFQNLQLVNSLTVHGEPAARRSLDAIRRRRLLLLAAFRRFREPKSAHARSTSFGSSAWRIWRPPSPRTCPTGTASSRSSRAPSPRSRSSCSSTSRSLGLNDREAQEISGVIRRIRDAGTSILLVEHNMDFVMQLADRVTVLDHGETDCARRSCRGSEESARRGGLPRRSSRGIIGHARGGRRRDRAREGQRRHRPRPDPARRRHSRRSPASSCSCSAPMGPARPLCCG